MDHEEDIASDLSAFHRIDDPFSIPGPRYFSLAYRLVAYRGVMRELMVAQQQEAEGNYSQHAGAGEKVAMVPAEALVTSLAADGWGEIRKEGS